MSFSVSIIISTPDFMIIADIITPTYASSETPVSRNITALKSTDADSIASNAASAPDAMSAFEFTFLPCFFT